MGQVGDKYYLYHQYEQHHPFPSLGGFVVWELLLAKIVRVLILLVQAW
jgi:hypothetical protein